MSKKDFERRKKEATMMYTYQTMDDVSEDRQVIAQKYKKAWKQNEEYEVEYRDVHEYLNKMERIATGINTDVFDIDLFNRICGGTTITYWGNMQSLCDEKTNGKGTKFVIYRAGKISRKVEENAEQLDG